MMSPNERQLLPSTFASVRFVADDLDPFVVSSFLHMKPTLSYRRGEKYTVGKNSQKQIRKFGMWLFRTESFVFSRSYQEHLSFLLFNIFFRAHTPKELKKFLGRTDYNMIFSLFWHGRMADGVPDLDDDYMRLFSDAGGKIEVEYDIIDLDDAAA